MSEHKNFVKMAVSGTPGTGTITLGSAVSGFQSLASAYGADATVDVSITDGTAWEVARQCTYTNSGTTLTRGTLEASSTGSAISLTSAAIVVVTATADFGRRMESAALNHVAGADSNTTMAVGALYVVDGATLTADRTYTLPAVAAVGDRIGVMLSAGSASYEVLLTAASGDTLNGIAGGTEWSRLFITGEVAIMRCIAANATWIVEYDGRIAQLGEMSLTADCDGEAANTTTLPTSAGTPGTWTVNAQIGIAATAATGRLTVRRGGKYSATVGMRAKDAPGASALLTAVIQKNGATVRSGTNTCTASLTGGAMTETANSASADDYFQMAYSTSSGGLGCRGAAALTFLIVSEVLP